jgi:hypothetical protein
MSSKASFVITTKVPQVTAGHWLLCNYYKSCQLMITYQFFGEAKEEDHHYKFIIILLNSH